jgi:hypothetical protein
MIYSPALITATFWGGSVLILLPLGLSRGILTSTISLVDSTGQETISRALESTSTLTSSSFSTSNSKDSILLTKERLEQYLTMGSGWQGQIFRTMASPFFPSTAQMLVRVQDTIDSVRQGEGGVNGDHHHDSQVVASAICGYIEGFLQDKKDTLTMVACFLYAMWLGIGFGIDYAWKRVDEERQNRRLLKENQQQASSGNEKGTGESWLFSKISGLRERLGGKDHEEETQRNPEGDKGASTVGIEGNIKKLWTQALKSRKGGANDDKEDQ